MEGVRGRHRRRKEGKRWGCAGCDPCDALTLQSVDCNVCGCDPFLMFIPLLRTVPTSLSPRPSVTAPGWLGLAAIRVYQVGVSPQLPIRCRYTPSCSEYGAQAVRRYGLRDGSRLAAARIRRCSREVPHGTPDPLL